MKDIIPAIVAFSTLFIVACDKDKAAVEARTDATKDAIDNRKVEVKKAASDAIKQTDINANIDKANI